jgi:hypothetical protein
MKLESQSVLLLLLEIFTIGCLALEKPDEDDCYNEVDWSDPVEDIQDGIKELHQLASVQKEQADSTSFKRIVLGFLGVHNVSDEKIFNHACKNRTCISLVCISSNARISNRWRYSQTSISTIPIVTSKNCLKRNAMHQSIVGHIEATRYNNG